MSGKRSACVCRKRRDQGTRVAEGNVTGKKSTFLGVEGKCVCFFYRKLTNVMKLFFYDILFILARRERLDKVECCGKGQYGEGRFDQVTRVTGDCGKALVFQEGEELSVAREINEDFYVGGEIN